MKYYLIAGEASGDLHASRLMHHLKLADPQAEFRYYGGGEMQTQGGTLVQHYRQLAYMGFVPVLMHLPTILTNMRRCKRDIKAWAPDAVILVDYPGFNLSIAKYVKKLKPSTFYYISPKIWAWKEYRIKTIKRCVDQLYSILPFEVDFFEGKHHYPIHYVGNPTVEEVSNFLESHKGIVRGKPILAILPGSRRQEIKDNLPPMLQAACRFADRYQVVVGGAPSIPTSYYAPFLEGHEAKIADAQTYGLLAEAHAALVTSGTATLETALFGVPQVVCYKTPLPRLIGWLRKRVLKVKYISLVNLIADAPVVRELVADSFSVKNIVGELERLLPPSSQHRQQMLQGYAEVKRRLGTQVAPENAARLMVEWLKGE